MKEGKINKDGVLERERAGKLKAQNCKRGGVAIDNHGDIYIEPCGDACALFGEPVKQKRFTHLTEKEPNFKLTGKTELTICQNRTLVFNKLTDERE
jgi:hypothetical protein